VQRICVGKVSQSNQPPTFQENYCPATHIFRLFWVACDVEWAGHSNSFACYAISGISGAFVWRHWQWQRLKSRLYAVCTVYVQCSHPTSSCLYVGLTVSDNCRNKANAISSACSWAPLHFTFYISLLPQRLSLLLIPVLEWNIFMHASCMQHDSKRGIGDKSSWL